MTKDARVVVLVGSPRVAGVCAALASQVAAGVASADVAVRVVRLADYDGTGCIGCGSCERTGTCVFDKHERAAVYAGGRPGLSALARELEAADALALVAPVYFSGPPSQLKALFDRLQPYWVQRYILGTRPPLQPPARPMGQRKPLDLVVVGTGADPFGYDALVSCARSALRMLDFELTELRDAVGADPHDPVIATAARAWGVDLGARVASVFDKTCENR